MTLKEVFAYNLRKYRIEAGFSKKGFARKSGYHDTHLRHIENLTNPRRGNPTLTVVEDLAQTLGIEPYKLFVPPPETQDANH